MRIIT